MSQRSSPLLAVAHWVRRTAVLLVGTVLLALILLLVWARQVAAADEPARFALDSDEVVLVSRDPWISFRPRDGDPVTGVIFYPGGKAEPTAYAPILRNLAARGYLVVMTPMPLNLAMLAPERAARVMARFPDIRHWVIAGHSLGGVVAAEFAERHVHEVAGVMLWASFPASFTDLSEAQFPVLSVSATADALSTPAKIAAARPLLPANTRYVVIEGGDHWNFGNFAPGKGTATITRDRQQAVILSATEAFLDTISPAPADADEP